MLKIELLSFEKKCNTGSTSTPIASHSLTPITTKTSRNENDGQSPSIWFENAFLPVPLPPEEINEGENYIKEFTFKAESELKARESFEKRMTSLGRLNEEAMRASLRLREEEELELGDFGPEKQGLKPKETNQKKLDDEPSFEPKTGSFFEAKKGRELHPVINKELGFLSQKHMKQSPKSKENSVFPWSKESLPIKAKKFITTSGNSIGPCRLQLQLHYSSPPQCPQEPSGSFPKDTNSSSETVINKKQVRNQENQKDFKLELRNTDEILSSSTNQLNDYSWEMYKKLNGRLESEGQSGLSSSSSEIKNQVVSSARLYEQAQKNQKSMGIMTSSGHFTKEKRESNPESSWNRLRSKSLFHLSIGNSK